MCKSLPTLAIVVPCYNEQEILQNSYQQLNLKLQSLTTSQKISNKSCILFVDDGSKDKTWSIIEQLHSNSLVDGNKNHEEDRKESAKNEHLSQLHALKLSTNKGHQNALLAGLKYAVKSLKVDITISIDADLQDDIDAIDLMVQNYLDGSEIVLGVRSDRTSDSFFKRLTAQTFYKFMNKCGVKTVYNHADFRLMSRKTVKQLLKYQEHEPFLRGIITLIGYKTTQVEYKRKERVAGESKYPLKKMLSFAWGGISSFSSFPLKIVTIIGFLICFISVIALIYCVIIKLFNLSVVGWAFMTCSIWIATGIQMLSIGVIGEYLSKVYENSKNRPKYFVETSL